MGLTASINKLVFPTDDIGGAVQGMSHSQSLHPTERYNIPYLEIDESRDAPRAVLLYSHGNAENLFLVEQRLRHLSQALSVVVVAYEYAGYGLHQLIDESKPSEKNVYEDAVVMGRVACELARAKEVPFIIYGRSLGSAPAIYTATKFQKEAHGLIVESGFRSCTRVVSNVLHSFYDVFDNEKVLKEQIKVRTIFIHGQQDRVVPFAHGKYLFEECRSPKEHFWIPDGHHNDLNSTYLQELLIKLDHFVARVSKRYETKNKQ